MNRLLVTVVSGTLLLGLGLVAPAVAQAAPSTPEVSNCGFPSAQPTDISLACADENTALEKLKWTKWNARTAKGTGVYTYNDCEPNCLVGTFRQRRVNVQLTTPKTVDGIRVFTKAMVIFPEGSGQSNKTFQLP
jgi:hypothetical protein